MLATPFAEVRGPAAATTRFLAAITPGRDAGRAGGRPLQLSPINAGPPLRWQPGRTPSPAPGRPVGATPLPMRLTEEKRHTARQIAANGRLLRGRRPVRFGRRRRPGEGVGRGDAAGALAAAAGPRRRVLAFLVRYLVMHWGIVFSASPKTHRDGPFSGVVCAVGKEFGLTIGRRVIEKAGLLATRILHTRARLRDLFSLFVRH